MSVSRSIFALVDDRDRAYFGRGGEERDQIGYIDEKTRAIFGRSYAAEPDVLVRQLKADEGIAEADTLLANGPEPARGRLQCACDRGDPDPCRPGDRVAVNGWAAKAVWRRPLDWSGRRESNPRMKLGKLPFYH